MIVPIQNSDVAEIFEKVADLLEIEGENRFRIRTYRNAARTVGGNSRSVAEMVEQDEDMTGLSGIGGDLAGKIREIVETGKLSQAEELEKKSDPGLRELLGLPGLGPERVREIHERLRVSSLQELEEGRPFVGNAGKLLDELLEEAGIDRSKVYVTNVVKVRPTKEDGGRTQNRPPRAGEIREGIEVLREELGFIKPEALVLRSNPLDMIHGTAGLT
jgi:hypothetical protein